jgi:hypothetical protein
MSTDTPELALPHVLVPDAWEAEGAVHGLDTTQPAPADAGTPADVTGLVVSVNPTGTTLASTVVPDPEILAGRYGPLSAGPGEAHVLRTDFVNNQSPQVNRPLIAFAQMSDLHIVDDQSPARLEYTDRLADPDREDPYPFNSAYRPHEFLSTQLTDAMCRAIANVRTGPVTGLPLRMTLVTGDVVDNCQYNETRWYIDLLDGRSITPTSGAAFDESVSGDALGIQQYYWHPEERQYEQDHDKMDNYYRAGFPDGTSLLAAARRGFQAHGLGMPWYTAFGNHDRNLQGNFGQGSLAGGKLKEWGSTQPTWERGF